LLSVTLISAFIIIIIIIIIIILFYCPDVKP